MVVDFTLGVLFKYLARLAVALYLPWVLCRRTKAASRGDSYFEALMPQEESDFGYGYCQVV